ncbi:O-antigen ligase family protein [Patescibacteria group bacterium]|nr:O-antigen ligase family protein [Patescibacteria group bacterium]
MKKINWTSIFSLIQKIAFWSSLLIIPLSMSFFFPIYSPFTLIKFFWLQLLGTIILLANLIIFKKNLLSVASYQRFIAGLAPLVLFLLGWSILSLFSVNLSQTWLGSYDRKMGLVFYYFLSVYFAYIVYYFSNFNFKEKIRNVMTWSRATARLSFLMMVSGSVVAIYACLQFIGYDFAQWQEGQLLGRAISTLGQPNFLASLLLLTVPLSILVLVKTKKILFLSLSLIAVILQFLALLMSGSRAAWLAIAVVAVLVLIVETWRQRHFKILWLIPLFLIFLVTTAYFVSPVRLQSLVNFNAGSIALRRSFYQAAGRVIPNNIWTGIGLENGGEVIVGQYQQDWGIFMKVDAYTDKVHNSVLDVIIQTGIIGLIFWLFLYIFWAWQCWRLWLKPQGRAFALAAASAMLAYAISLFFGLADIAGVFYFWILAAFVVAGNLSLSEESSLRDYFIKWKKLLQFFKQGIRLSIRQILMTIIAAILFGLAASQAYTGLNSLQADYYFLQIYRLLPTQRYFHISALSSYILETEKNPVNLHYYERSIGLFALNDFKVLPDLSSKKVAQILINDIYKLLPEDVYENKLVKSNLVCYLEGAENARAIFSDLFLLSPRRPLVYRNWAECLQSSAMPDESLLFYDKSLDLLPSINDPRLNEEHKEYLAYYLHRIKNQQGDLYQELHQYEEAISAYSQAYTYFSEDMSSLKKKADVYYLLKNLESSKDTLQQILKREPTNFHIILNLAVVYQELGDEKKAQIYWEKASALVPGEALPALTELIYF